MKKIIGVILIIGGIFFASLAVKALVSAPQSYEKIRVAATIKDGNSETGRTASGSHNGR